MTKHRINRLVREFFTHRKYQLRAMNGKGVRRDADFLELYGLYRVVQAAPNFVTKGLKPGAQGRSVFVVALGPSSRWSEASWFEVTLADAVLGVRTGLEVCARTPEVAGTVELDVVIARLDTDPASGAVIEGEAIAGLECKAHSKTLTNTHANEMIGKAARVWGIPVPVLSLGEDEVERYAIVSMSTMSSNGMGAPQAQGIRFCVAHDKDLAAHIDALWLALGAKKQKRAV